MITLTTPALLFPAISLLLLAYTNRFVVLTQVIRNLHGQYRNDLPDDVIRQIANLRLRIVVIRRMQAFGVSSFILCAMSMFLIFINRSAAAEYIFGCSLLLLVLSLALSLYEIAISTKAIEIQLESIEHNVKKNG